MTSATATGAIVTDAPLVTTEAPPSNTQTSSEPQRQSYITIVIDLVSSVFWKIVGELVAFCEYLKRCFQQNDPETLRLHGHGIENGGNACYISSVLQATRFDPRV